MRTVESVLTDLPRTIARTDAAWTAQHVMLRDHVYGLAVVEDRHRLVGIVTAFDLLRDLPTDAEVEASMSTEVLTASPHTSVVDAARTMRQHHIHHLVVTGHGDEVIGVVSSFDLLDALAGEVPTPGSTDAPGAADHRAEVGDIVVVRGKAIDQRQRRGLITEVRGQDGLPPYLVRWFDDPHAEPHDVLYFPGPDADIEHPADA